MPSQLLATKFFIPTKQQNLVPRPRLLKMLDKALSRKLTLLSAPAGFGKTTLVSDWVSQRGEPVVWLSLDKDDSDPRRFWLYFITALQTVSEEIGTASLGMLQQPNSSPNEDLLTTLVNEITAFSEDFIMVLDDFHLVDSTDVDENLTFLLEYLPPQMHLMMTTREDPGLPIARLRARAQLNEIRASDLRFTSMEAAEFLNQAMGMELSTEDVAALETRTEGWIAGLQLAALSMQGNRDAHSFVESFAGTHRFILDYLLEEVLQKQSEITQEFLLRTSILDRLSASLCDALLQDETIYSQQVLESLERSNIFTVPLDGERLWYRYHHLFGDLLRQRLGQTLSADKIARDHIRASKWYEKNGEMHTAFRHAITAGDFNRAAGLAEKGWEAMDEALQARAWLAWMEELPGDIFSHRPVLCTQIAWSLIDTGQAAQSERWLQKAEQALEVSSEKMVVVEKEQFDALPARIAFARAYNAQAIGTPAETLKFAEQALKLVPDNKPFLAAQIKSILGTVYWSNGNLLAAAKSMREWMDSAEKAGNVIFAIASAYGLADILFLQGNLREAKRALEQSLVLAEKHDQAQAVIANHYVGLAVIAHETVDDETAQKYIEAGLKLAKQSTLVDTTYRIYLIQAQVKELNGALDEALELLAEAKRIYVETPVPNTRPIEALIARIHLKQGNLGKAQEWAQESNLSMDDDIVYLREFELLTFARVLIAEGKQDDALSLLKRLLEAAEKDKRTASMIEILLVQTQVHEANDEKVAALKRALDLAEPEGYLRIFVREGDALAGLLRNINSEYGRKILAAFAAGQTHSLSGQNPANVHERGGLIDPLSKRELEVLHWIAEGLKNQEIADKLFISLHTVKVHAKRTYAKLGVSSRTQAVAKAKEIGILR